MTCWKSWSGGTLEVRASEVVLQKDGQTHAATWDAVLSGALDRFIVEVFEIATLAEVYAVLQEARLPADQRILIRSQEPLHRPRIPRLFGGGRGSKFCVWLRNGKVIASVEAQPRYEEKYMKFLESGFPLPLQQALGALTDVAAIVAGVQALTALPCDCGTGCEEIEHHRTLQTFGRVNHPFAPIECWATVGRCWVCGQAWTFEGAGDSHYSYTFSVRSFSPDRIDPL